MFCIYFNCLQCCCWRRGGANYREEGGRGGVGGGALQLFTDECLVSLFHGVDGFLHNS